MAQYLTKDTLPTRAVVPREWIEDVEREQPGWIDIKLEEISDWIDGRLRKRYAAPFSEPTPKCVLRWVAKIAALDVLHRRGVNAQDQQYEDIRDEAHAAKAEVLEAANSETGLFDLPLRADTAESGITQGGPMGYSEQSPYVWADGQRETGRNEDQSGRGTGG